MMSKEGARETDREGRRNEGEKESRRVLNKE